MSPAPDKIRPWLYIYCQREGCSFVTKAEFEGLRHQDETGHSMDWLNAREFPLNATAPHPKARR